MGAFFIMMQQITQKTQQERNVIRFLFSIVCCLLCVCYIPACLRIRIAA